MSSPLGHTNYSWCGTDENTIPLGHTIYSWSALIQNNNKNENNNNNYNGKQNINIATSETQKLKLYSKHPLMAKDINIDVNLIAKKVVSTTESSDATVTKVEEKVTTDINVVEEKKDNSIKIQQKKAAEKEEKKKTVVPIDKKLIEEKLNQAKNATDSGIGVLPLIVKENTPANKVKCETAKTDNKTVTKTMPKEITSSPAINSTRNTQQPRQEKEEEPQVPKGGGCCTIS